MATIDPALRLERMREYLWDVVASGNRTIDGYLMLQPNCGFTVICDVDGRIDEAATSDAAERSRLEAVARFAAEHPDAHDAWTRAIGLLRADANGEAI